MFMDIIGEIALERTMRDRGVDAKGHNA
jgi:hypothetical protein